MKKIIYIHLLGILVFSLLFACEPFLEEKPEAGVILPPSETEMDFSITPGEDVYHFNIALTAPASLSGIAQVSFDLGNGSIVNGNSGVAYYPLPGDYTISMTIKTNSGSTTVSKAHTTTETDYSIFNDPKFIILSGGVDQPEGRTWVVDSLSLGHYGIGPADMLSGPSWWAATPLQKSGMYAYDDKLTFKIEGFEVVQENNGKSYIKDYLADNPNYSNLVDPGDDLIADFTPQPGTWFIEEKDDQIKLTLSGPTPIFPGFDTGAENGEYTVFVIEENKIEMACIGGDGNAWFYKLIPEGYVAPTVGFELSAAAGTGSNEYDISLTDINVPAGQSIDKLTYDFGDGSEAVETTDLNEVVSNTYMRMGSYLVTLTAETSIGTIKKSTTVTVTDNHPDYVEFLLDEIVMYADFSEVELAPVSGEDCDVSVVANPDRTYPNKSTNVAFYSKTGQQWANANMQLAPGYRFDLRQKSVVKLKVFGKAGQEVLLKFENTDRGGNAWQTGAELKYTIQQDDTWEVVEYDFSGVPAGFDWTGDIFTSDIVADDNFNHGFYNIIRIMLNPGNGEGTHEFYFDELAGPHVEGLKSATF